MILEKEIIGKYSKLRSVEIDDAEFILSLRLDDKLNRYINKVDNDINRQKEWIKLQQKRKGDYYFIISDLNNHPLGTISLYNIKDENAEFGRWVSKGNMIVNIESAILIYEFAFENLKLDLVYTNTMAENKQVVNFHKRFGAKVDNEFYFDKETGFTFSRGYINSQLFVEIKRSNYEKIGKLL